MSMEDLTGREMEVIITVFRSFETGLREATIYPNVIVVDLIPKANIKCSSDRIYLIKK